MINRNKKLNDFEKTYLQKTKLSHRQALKIYNALHKEAYRLGLLNKDVMDGVESDIRIARAVNALRPCKK